MCSKFLTGYEMGLCRLPRPAPLGAHKRRPYARLTNRSVSDYEMGLRGLPRPFRAPPWVPDRSPARRYFAGKKTLCRQDEWWWEPRPTPLGAHKRRPYAWLSKRCPYKWLSNTSVTDVVV